EAFDFTHPFYSAGLGIAVKPLGERRWLGAVERFFSLEFLTVVGLLVVVLLAVGILVWLFERRRNAGQFGGPAGKGIGAAFWWSAVTMTTVGYGDKAPRTLPGRLIAITWMFAGIILISTFTAAITSTLTVTQLEMAVRGPEDLPNVRVATVAGSTSEQYLKRRKIPYRSMNTPLEALRSVAEGETDAVVYDAPILRYLANTEIDTPLRVLSTEFERQDYAIGLKSDSPLREPINRELLRKTADASWQSFLQRYLGD
ncbi:MAG: transporter substrate-binding domain-containing protein, partial [bacterium]